MDIRNFKDNAKAATAYLAEHGIEVSHTRFLEALSRTFGERNWSTLLSKLNKLNGTTVAESAPVEPLEWVAEQGPMTEAQYVFYAGHRCPFCGCYHLEAGDLEADGPKAWDQTNCQSCGASWSSAYSLSGYFDASNSVATPDSPATSTPADSIVGKLLGQLTDKQGIVLTVLSEDGSDWRGYVFRAKDAFPVLASVMHRTQTPKSLEDILNYTTSNMVSALDKLVAASVWPVYTSVKFDEPSARESALTMASSAYGLDVLMGIREDIVEDIVTDVRTRAREYSFSIGNGRRARELARESAQALDLDATEAEVFEAALRLA